MRVEMSGPGVASGALRAEVAVRSGVEDLRIFVIAAGLCWSVLFVTVGLRYGLEMYGDGAIFSYSVAVRDAWAFHWHNISGRLFVYLFSLLPAESYVALTGDARGGIALYGLSFYVAQLIGLAATFVADRSKGRIIFSYACFSTACLCPLVFGFPTEMWMAHALFWPTLAFCHYAERGGFALVFVALLALVFTHAGALVLIAAIFATLLLRGVRDAALIRAGRALLLVMTIWAAVHAMFPPDAYFASAVFRAALHFFDVSILTCDLMRLLVAALAGYGAVVLLLRRRLPAHAHACAAAIVVVALAVYWLRFDHALHAENRYYLRTVMLLAMPVLGGLAAIYALDADGRKLSVPFLSSIMGALARAVSARAAAGAILVVMLVHAVETAKFVSAWTEYTAAVRTLAMGAASDRALGDRNFVSSHRIGARLDPLAWFSTMPFLSVLVAPHFAPARLVVDPTSSYFWLSCATATENMHADRALPVQSRRLVRAYSCLHRP